LYPEMFLVDYLIFIGELRSMSPELIRRRVKEIISLCGLKDVLGKRIGELSKGYRQRVGFASALLPDPQILILDEPTLGLDPNQVLGIRELIRELGKEKTIMLSTHILKEVEETCNRVIIISKGKIVADGKPQEMKELAQAEARIKLVFGALPAGLETLSQIPGVESCRTAGNTVFVTTMKGSNPRKEIIKKAAQNSWDIEEMYTEKIDLESVFRTLTKEEAVEEKKENE
ncbi:MAG TPA: ATP-binding cassette domain-containing protein, partial [bacterium]|nr:ATP-binding cassette domain-containing protein [bacterium]